MLELKYKMNLVRLTETYSYGPPPIVNNADFHLHSCLLPEPAVLPQSSKRIFIFYKLFRTLLIDLEKNEQDIFNEMGKNTRYDIRRAEREGVEYEEINNPSDKEIEKFALSFNKFAAQKNIRPCDPEKLKACSQKGAFIITMAKVGNEIICIHGYLFDGGRAIMLYSASFRDSGDSKQRNLIGRANRFLHWKAILSFKKKGGKWYDFCGLSLEGGGLEGINKFKKGFGGMEADELKTYRGINLLGKLMILALRWKWRNQPEYIRAKRMLHSGEGGEGLGRGSS